MGLRAGNGAATAASKRRAEVWKLRAAKTPTREVVSARDPAESILDDILRYVSDNY
jgi:hypothetical protein